MTTLPPHYESRQLPPTPSRTTRAGQRELETLIEQTPEKIQLAEGVHTFNSTLPSVQEIRALYSPAIPILPTATVAAALPHAVTPEDLAALQQCKSMGSVTLMDVQLVSRLLRAHPAESICGYWVHELLRGATPLLPERAAKPPPHPELGPRLERLRAVQADREYARMIGGSKADPDSIGRDAAEMNTYRSQLAVGANLLVSMGTSFIVGAWCGGTEKEPYGVRAVLCGTALMIR